MPRGKKSIEKTRRILTKILQGVPAQQIAFEEQRSQSYIANVKSRYTTPIGLRLNSKGLKLMDNEQMSFSFWRRGKANPNA